MAINYNIPFDSNLLKVDDNQFTNKFKIRYNNNPIYIILPKLPCENTIKQSSNNSYYCYLLFSDQDIDLDIHHSLMWLNSLENHVSVMYNELNYRYKISKSSKMSINWNQNVECFDQFNNQISNINSVVNSITHIIALIEIPYIWKNMEQYGVCIKVRQLKCFSENINTGISLLNIDTDRYLNLGDLKIDLELPIPIIKNILTEYFSSHCIKNNPSIPPPPPPVSINPPISNLPPPPPPLTIKKVVVNKQKSKITSNPSDKPAMFKIQLDDLLLARQKLKKLDNDILFK